MTERSRQLLLIGAGVVLGSVSTVALLKLFSRELKTPAFVDGILRNPRDRKHNRDKGGAVKDDDTRGIGCTADFINAIKRDDTSSSKKQRCIDNMNTVKSQRLPADYLMADGKVSLSQQSTMVTDKLIGGDSLQDEIVSEQLTRNIQFFGIESQEKVTESYVVVIGLGGVGSHAASMILRSGVGKLLLVDFDQVSLSSLNRHAVATRDDVGTPKALCLQKHFQSIFPECQVDAKVLMYDASSEHEILSGQPDFVLDCIDNIDTKVALLAACVRRGLRVLSATGAGARADPTRIRIADLRESTTDPLSRAVRHRLRRDHGIEGGIPVVFSLEKPKAKLLPFKAPTGEEENPSDYQIVPGFRVRIIPVLGTIPAIFGQVMASYVVTSLAGLSVQTEPVVNLDLDHYRILHQRLLEHEEALYGSSSQVLVDVEEVMYVVKELWHGRSAKAQSTKDVARKMWRSVNELMLVRWDQAKPATVANLILLKFKEAEEHESTTIDIIKEREPAYFDMVTCVLKRAEREFAL